MASCPGPRFADVPKQKTVDELIAVDQTEGHGAGAVPLDGLGATNAESASGPAARTSPPNLACRVGESPLPALTLTPRLGTGAG